MGETVVISGGYPFGFRVSGGAEHKQNIIVSRISPGSNAYNAGLKVGDVIELVNDRMCNGWTQNAFTSACEGQPTLKLKIRRPVTETRIRVDDADATNLAEQVRYNADATGE